jgi:hypothetical protein
MYFRDENYPPLPTNWQAVINDYGAYAGDVWFELLKDHRPDRINYY